MRKSEPRVESLDLDDEAECVDGGREDDDDR